MRKINREEGYWIKFVFEENSVGEITWLSLRYRFRKAPFSIVFRPHAENENPAFSNSSGVKSVFGVFSKSAIIVTD